MNKLNVIISIIMPCYNASETINDAIKSVIAQDYDNWELLITDDCSTDNSVSIVKEYCEKDDRVKLFELKENAGVANARNNSISFASGSYIAFLDSDDKWHSRKLSVQIDYMLKNNVDFSYTAYQKINNGGDIVSSKIKVRDSGISYHDLLKHNEMGCLTIMLKKDLLEGIKFKKVGHEDYVFWLSILKSGIQAFGINEVLAYYRVGDKSLSSDKRKAIGFTWNIYRKEENLGLVQSSYYFMNYAIKSYLKSLK